MKKEELKKQREVCRGRSLCMDKDNCEYLDTACSIKVEDGEAEIPSEWTDEDIDFLAEEE